MTSKSTDEQRTDSVSIPTETADDIKTLLSRHRSSDWKCRKGVRGDEVVVFVRTDDAQALAGFPYWFHEFAGSHHIRVIDIELVERNGAIALPKGGYNPSEDTRQTTNPYQDEAYAIRVRAESSIQNKGKFITDRTRSELEKNDGVETAMRSEEDDEVVIFLTDEVMRSGLPDTLAGRSSQKRYRILDAMRLESESRSPVNPPFFPATAVFIQPAERTPTATYATWESVPEPPTGNREEH